MHLVTHPTAVSTKPVAAPTGTVGYFSSALPGSGGVTTTITADVLNTLVDEVANVVVASGQTLSNSNDAQLLAAIQSLISSGPGRLINTQVIIVSGIYIPTPGTNTVEVEIVGGGAAGGGTISTSASTTCAGGGGGAGSYSRSGRLTSGFSGVTVTIGAGGTGVLGATGGSGSTTSFGTLLSAPGGSGGTCFPTSAIPNSSAGGSGGSIAVGGLVNGSGSPGMFGLFVSTTGVTSGSGGSTIFGGGAVGLNFSQNGRAATGFGSGGSGAAAGTSQGTFTGGAGRPGVCIIREYA